MEDGNKAETKPSKSSAQHDKNKQRVSVRFQLHLSDSTDRSFPEFSYMELMGTANKNKKKEEDVLPQDEDCNMEEIRALAKKFEDKYAPKVVAKNKKAMKTDRVQDLVDVTYGYDITDSFVDDSEAYDELVPADWTTEHGGFYINMGELNFRPISSGDEKSDSDFKDSRKKKTPKKIKEHKERKIKEGKRCLSGGEKEKNVKKIRLNSDDKEKKVKYKKSISSDGQLNGSTGNGLTQDNLLPRHNASGLSKTMSPVSLQSPVNKLEKSNISDVMNTTSGDFTGIHMNSSHDVNENDSSTVNGSAAVTLPEGLPPSLILSVQKLIEAARRAGGDGKCKFFNSDVNRILLQIETDSRKLNCRARSAVYDYLALFLPCTKETLLKRAKNLFMQEQVGRLREPLLKLRHAVEVAMPDQVRHYEEEMARLAEDQAAQSQKPCSEVVPQNGEKKDEQGIKILEAEGENDKTEEATTPTDVNAPTTPVEEKGKRTLVPKRFVWKEDIRNLLCDVVRIKVELYLMSKSRSTTAEEALKGFLETEVRPIWPKGWMTTRILYRESKHAHAKVTSTIISKVKKVLKKPKDDESTGVVAANQSVKVEPGVLKSNEEKKPENLVTITSVTLPSGAVSEVPKSENVRQKIGNRPLSGAKVITCSPSPVRTTSQPNVTGKTILDLLDNSPGRTMQAKNNNVEQKPIVNEIKKITVVPTTKTLPSCSFESSPHQQLVQITPPRSIKPQTAIPNSSPSHSSLARTPSANISSVRLVSSVPGKFNPANPVTTTRLPSCSLMSSPALPTKSNQVSVSSAISSRQNFNYVNKVPSIPRLSYKFQLQSPKTNPENLQRTHSNALPTNFVDLASPPKTKPPLTATSLLNSIARSNIPPNHVPSNASLVGQSPQVNPSSIQNPLQEIAASMNTNPHTISSIIGLQNNVMQNKPLKVHGVFPGGLGTFSGLPQQFAGQPAVHRNTTTKELKEGNTTPSSFQPTYGAPFS